MLFRKRQKRFRHSVRIILGALVINLLFPITPAHAESMATSVSLQATRGPVAVAPEPPAGPPTLLPTIANKLVPVVKRMTIRASAYTSTVAETDNSPFITANGTRVRDGIVAMNGVPFGTKVRIPSHYGSKVFTVTDRMNSRWGTQRIDIWMTTRTAALQWGVRTVTVEILKS